MSAESGKREILLVGSVGLPSAEDVFRTVSGAIGDRVKRIPDGETGIRSVWVIWNRAVFEACPALEVDPTEKAAGGRITSATEGIRRWQGGAVREKGAQPPPRLRVRDGAKPADIVFGPLGHADHAKTSYALFRKLRDQGVIRQGTRFQVSLPTVAAAMNAHIVPAHHHLVEEPLTRRLLADVAEICAAIPHQDLALQWDISTEMGQWEGVRPAWFTDDIKGGVIARLTRHIDAVPADVELGMHLCYGSYGGRHWMEPKDTGNCVAVYNGVAAKVKRPIHWVHMPVPIDRSDDAYFAPLKDIRLRPETRLYLGLIHDADGVDGTRRRIATAAKYATGFGIATECGFGRRPPDTIPNLLKVHAEI